MKLEKDKLIKEKLLVNKGYIFFTNTNLNDAKFQSLPQAENLCQKYGIDVTSVDFIKILLTLKINKCLLSGSQP